MFTVFPSDFQNDFLHNSMNKQDLNLYLAEKMVSLHLNSSQIFVVTYHNTILSNSFQVLGEELINNCPSEEADARLIRHSLNLADRFKHIHVRTVDTDVFILLVAYYRMLQQRGADEVIAFFGSGKHVRYFNIKEIALTLKEEICTALPFFHSFSGCDTVSSFFNKGKCKLWDTWMQIDGKTDRLTNTFNYLGDMPEAIRETDLQALSNYVQHIYMTGTLPSSLDKQRMHQFIITPDIKLRSLPISLVGLTEHIKRACLQCWYWKLSVLNVDVPDPLSWGWKKMENNKLVPLWQDPNIISMDIKRLLATCTCSTGRCSSCTCGKNEMKCLPFCKGQRQCNAK